MLISPAKYCQYQAKHLMLIQDVSYQEQQQAFLLWIQASAVGSCPALVQENQENQENPRPCKMGNISSIEADEM